MTEPEPNVPAALLPGPEPETVPSEPEEDPAVPEPADTPSCGEMSDEDPAPETDTEEALQRDPETDAPPSSRIRPALTWLRIALPWTMAGMAALVFALSAVSLLRSADLSRERIVRTLAGTFLGGADRIAAAHPSPDDPSDKAFPDSASLPLPDPALLVPAGPEKADSEEQSPEAAESVPEPVGEKDPGVPAEKESENRTDGVPPVPIRFTNETGYEPDPADLLDRPRAVPPLAVLRETYGPEAPVVLILHTHGTEAFAECADEGWRSRDPGLSVVSLGERLADRLREADIPALHLTELFDEPDFNLSYYNAARAIRDALELAPSISYILDLHRDSMTFPDGTVYAPVTEVSGRRTAQLMFVVGTDEAGAEHPDWRDNLALALRLQTSLSSRYPTLMRDVNLRSASFNEQYTKGSLLIEAGAAGCTLDEAEAAVDLLADALIGEIRGDG